MSETPREPIHSTVPRNKLPEPLTGPIRGAIWNFNAQPYWYYLKMRFTRLIRAPNRWRAGILDGSGKDLVGSNFGETYQQFSL
jgi:hypothetical protein